MLKLEYRPGVVAAPHTLEVEKVDPNVELLDPGALVNLNKNGTVDGRRSRILAGIYRRRMDNLLTGGAFRRDARDNTFRLELYMRIEPDQLKKDSDLTLQGTRHIDDWAPPDDQVRTKLVEYLGKAPQKEKIEGMVAEPPPAAARFTTRPMDIWSSR